MTKTTLKMETVKMDKTKTGLFEVLGSLAVIVVIVSAVIIG
jgi:hypothetical protein